jgi:hypothetical protein
VQLQSIGETKMKWVVKYYLVVAIVMIILVIIASDSFQEGFKRGLGDLSIYTKLLSETFNELIGR